VVEFSWKLFVTDVSVDKKSPLNFGGNPEFRIRSLDPDTDFGTRFLGGRICGLWLLLFLNLRQKQNWQRNNTLAV